MKKNIKNLTFWKIILSFYLVIVLFFQIDFHYLIPSSFIPFFLKGNFLVSLLVLSAVVFTFVCYIKFYKLAPKQFFYLLSWDFICFFFWIVLVLYSQIKYPLQDFSYTITSHIILLYCFFTIPILTLSILCGKIRYFQIVSFISFLWAALIIFVRFVYVFSGSLPFSFSEAFEVDGFIRTRTYGVRISFTMVGILSVLLDLYLFKSIKTKKYRYLISYLIKFYALIYVDQSRVLILICVVSSIIFLIYSSYKANVIQIFRLVILLIIPLFLIVFMLNQKQFNQDYSFTARIQSYQYYLNVFLDTFFLGNGISSDLIYPMVQKGPMLTHFYSDVGIVGLMGKIGLFSIPIFCSPLCYCFIAAIKNNNKMKPLLLSICAIFILSLPTLIQVSLNFPLMIALAIPVFIVSKNEFKNKRYIIYEYRNRC